MKKVCKKCGEEKTSGDFNKQTARKDGLHPYCKPCLYKYGEMWRKNHRDRVRAGKKRRYEATGGHGSRLSQALSDRQDKQEFSEMLSDGMSLASAVGLLKVRHQLKVLALAIVGSGDAGASKEYLLDTVYKSKHYGSLKSDVFWLRRHLVGTGLRLENIGWGLGYRVVAG